MTTFGLMHSYQLLGNAPDYLFAFQNADEGATVYRAWDIAIGYTAFAGLFAATGLWFRASREETKPLNDPRPQNVPTESPLPG